MAGDDVLAELGLDSDFSDDSGTSDSLDLDALLPPSGTQSPEHKTSTGVLAPKEAPSAVGKLSEPEPPAKPGTEESMVLPPSRPSWLQESSEAEGTSSDEESHFDVEALLEAQHGDAHAPAETGSLEEQQHQSVPLAPRASSVQFEEPALVREADASDPDGKHGGGSSSEQLPHHPQQQSEIVHTIPSDPSCWNALSEQEALAPDAVEIPRDATDGTPQSGTVAQAVERLERAIRSRSTSPAPLVIHQPQLPRTHSQARTPDASPTRRSQANVDAETVEEAKPELIAKEPVPAPVPESTAPESESELLKRLEKANSAAEDLWQEQHRLEISCEVARSLGCVKAEAEIFLAQVAELRCRAELHSAAQERLGQLRAAAKAVAAPAKPEDLEELEGMLSKAQSSPEALRCMALDLRTRCRQKEAILRVKMEHEARRLRGQIFASIAARAKAEARLAQALAANKSAEAQHWRRTAKASLEMRRRLQDGGSPASRGSPSAARKAAFVPAARKPEK
ncbi:unnamed protein product [Symbiodinium natans]|uniref:Uncharacterized protein n=1 Tax=Symbiodinium natans TaxID=878477 RepID=A0A812RGE0_9DINO|nr:unnamed protein product [Symbiodinium natans]